MENKPTRGRCFCGAVEIELEGEAQEMGYCNCESCRHWSASPVNAYTLWPATVLKVTRGEDKIGTFSKTPVSQRKWCKRCGGHVFTAHPEHGIVDVYAASRWPDPDLA